MTQLASLYSTSCSRNASIGQGCSLSSGLLADDVAVSKGTLLDARSKCKSILRTTAEAEYELPKLGSQPFVQERHSVRPLARPQHYPASQLPASLDSAERRPEGAGYGKCKLHSLARPPAICTRIAVAPPPPLTIHYNGDCCAVRGTRVRTPNVKKYARTS